MTFHSFLVVEVYQFSISASPFPVLLAAFKKFGFVAKVVVVVVVVGFDDHSCGVGGGGGSNGVLSMMVCLCRFRKDLECLLSFVKGWVRHIGLSLTLFCMSKCST